MIKVKKQLKLIIYCHARASFSLFVQDLSFYSKADLQRHDNILFVMPNFNAKLF